MIKELEKIVPVTPRANRYANHRCKGCRGQAEFAVHWLNYKDPNYMDYQMGLNWTNERCELFCRACAEKDPDVVLALLRMGA